MVFGCITPSPIAPLWAEVGSCDNELWVPRVAGFGIHTLQLKACTASHAGIEEGGTQGSRHGSITQAENIRIATSSVCKDSRTQLVSSFLIKIKILLFWVFTYFESVTTTIQIKML